MESGQAFMFPMPPKAQSLNKCLHDLCDSLRIPKFVGWPLVVFNLILFAIVIIAFLCCVFDLITPGNIGSWISNNKKYIPSVVFFVMACTSIFTWWLYTQSNGEMPLFIPLFSSLICLYIFYWLYGFACAELLLKHWKMILGFVVTLSFIVGIVIYNKMV